jgi:hypothetical protein
MENSAMTMVSTERILGSIGNNLQALSGIRGKQENLIQFAETLGFSLLDVDQGLSHAIVLGGATGAGDVWPLHWQQARNLLSAEQVKQIEEAYAKIIDQFPQELKDEHPNAFR